MNRETARWLEIAEGIDAHDEVGGISDRLVGGAAVEWQAVSDDIKPHQDWLDWRCLTACLFAAMTPAERREIGLRG